MSFVDQERPSIPHEITIDNTGVERLSSAIVQMEGALFAMWTATLRVAYSPQVSLYHQIASERAGEVATGYMAVRNAFDNNHSARLRAGDLGELLVFAGQQDASTEVLRLPTRVEIDQFLGTLFPEDTKNPEINEWNAREKKILLETFKIRRDSVVKPPLG